MGLDTKTAYFFLFLANLLMGLSLLLAEGRRLRDGEGMWTASVFVQGAGMLVIIARGPIPVEVSIIVGSTLMSASLSLAYLSVCRIFAQRRSLAAAVLPVLIDIVFLVLFVDDSRLRLPTVGVVHGLQELLVLRVLTRPAAIAQGGRPLWLLLAGYSAGAAVFLGRALAASHIPVYMGTQMPTNIVDSLSLSLGFAGIIATGFGMLLLHRQFMERETERLATLDSLTGIYNRRILMDLAARALALSQRRKSPLALAMLDLDDFKLVNDRHGHQVGDLVLVHTVKQMQSQLRTHDLPGRYGGEEFCVVFPETGADGAAVVAERIRSAIERHPPVARGAAIPVTASIGIAVSDGQHGETLDELLGLADQAMYEAKAGGRNRVVVKLISSPRAASA